jgi:ornithine--oxo-acid transaminase
MVVLAKALSGGLVPCSAVLMSDAICNSVYSSLKRALIHTSTFGENSLAMRAGLVTLDILEDEQLGQRATIAGERLRRALVERLAKYEMISEIRGLGLLNAIEFKAPRSLRFRIPFETFAKIHPAIFGQIVVMRMFRDHGILNQVCGNDFMVLKISPPLMINEEQLDRFVFAIEQVVDSMHTSSSFWTEALGIAQRVVGSI